MMLGQHRPHAFSYDRQPVIAGYLNGSGAPARGKLIALADAKGRGKASVTHACARCGGAGGADKWEHTGWTCFDCQGTGIGKTGEETVYTPEAYARLEAIRAKRAAKKADEHAAKIKALNEENDRLRAARRAAFDLAYPGLGEAVVAYAGQQDEHGCKTFMAQMAEELAVRGELTEKQAAAAQRSIDKVRAKEARRAASTWAGQIGDVIEETLTNVRTIDISYGKFPTIYRYVVIMESASGQTFKYIGTSSAVPYKTGETMRIRAKISSFDEYDGVKQTVIERPREVHDEKPATLKAVNKAIAAKGIKAELFKGDRSDYFYFFGPAVETCRQQGVYGVYRVGDLTVAQWLNELNTIMENKV